MATDPHNTNMFIGLGCVSQGAFIGLCMAYVAT